MKACQEYINKMKTDHKDRLEYHLTKTSIFGNAYPVNSSQLFVKVFIFIIVYKV